MMTEMQPFSIYELKNFDKFGLFLNENSNESKDAKDLKEMRIVQVFKDNIPEDVQLAITVEKADDFLNNIFPSKVHLGYPEKEDRI